MWWRWRMDRAQSHLLGFGEYRRLGTVITSVQLGSWCVEDDESRVYYISKTLSSPPGLRVGDRVEIEPRFPGTASHLRDWAIARRLDGQ
jgi:hypothetical protein